MTTNSFRKKAISVGRLVRAYNKVLGNVVKNGGITAREMEILEGVRARLSNKVVGSDGNPIKNYLGTSLGRKNQFGKGEEKLFNISTDAGKSSFIEALSEDNLGNMPWEYRKLRALLDDIHSQHMPQVDYKSIRGQARRISRIPIRENITPFNQRLERLRTIMSGMPDELLSSVFLGRNALNASLAEVNRRVRSNGKIKRYTPIFQDTAGRKFYKDRKGFYFTLVLDSADPNKKIYKVTRLIDKNGELVPEYNTRQYWSNDQKQLKPGDFVLEKGKIIQPWNYADGSPYASRIKEVSGGTQLQGQTAINPIDTTGNNTPVRVHLDPTLWRVQPTFKIHTGGTAISQAGAPAVPPANPAVSIFNLFGDTSSPSAYRFGPPTETPGRSHVVVPFNPTQTFSVGDTPGAQSSAARQTVAAQNLQSDTLPDTGNPPFFTSLGRGVRRHLLRNRGIYGTLGGSIAGSTITSLLSGGGGSGVSQEDLLRMSQWQHAYTMAMEQRSLWLRLSGGMLSVPGNFLANLRSYGWTDLQINAYRKRFAGA